MSLEIVGVFGIGIMLALMFLRIPLGIGMMITGVAGLICIVGLEQTLSTFGMSVYRTASTYMMTVIPLFIFMGILASQAGLSGEAFYAVNKWLGHLPGGMAMATVGGCAAFAAVCGAAVATASTMCAVALPEMRKYKYADQLSLGAISCGGMLGFMIPPSIAFVIYSVLTEVSIGTLFMAGILPGILIAILFMAAIYVVCRLNPSLGPVGPKATWRERFSVLYRVWGILVLFFLVLGGMYGGVFTPTEAGAVGAFGALVLGLSKRRLSWQGFNSALSQTVRLTGMIFMLIIGATIFNYFLALTEIPFSMARLVGELPVSPVFILTALLIMYIILGFIMDIMAVMILSVPIVYPILLALDINPVWFGVLVVLTIMMGNVTPPVGIVVYTVGGLVKDVPLFTIFRGVVPFLLAMLIGMGILIAFPQISLFLPNLMKPG